MILAIITTVLSFLGVFGYYFNIPVWLVVGAAATIIQITVDVLNKKFKNVIPLLIGYILGSIFIPGSQWIGISVGLCYENTIMNLITFVLIIWSTKKGNINTVKKATDKKKGSIKTDKNIICSIIIASGIVIVVILLIWSKSHEAKLNREYEMKKIEEENQLKQNEESKRRLDLEYCISDAKEKRSRLWKINDDDGDNRLNYETINWIEKRYQSDIDICRSKYQ